MYEIKNIEQMGQLAEKRNRLDDEIQYLERGIQDQENITIALAIERKKESLKHLNEALRRFRVKHNLSDDYDDHEGLVGAN